MTPRTQGKLGNLSRVVNSLSEHKIGTSPIGNLNQVVQNTKIGKTIALEPLLTNCLAAGGQAEIGVIKYLSKTGAWTWTYWNYSISQLISYQEMNG